ncbi:MAG: NTP/NDP exchange transporter [Alphaproteobacteria bacterium]|nr:NTP/NDP exchange transporter [Alphaproteobacteria bacterium]NCQ67190.1 NTP/NDP exchange transporter [Alphaproteobacteria bacterium]NCT07034.1 NTP/NDP exchange transporter [Alphaproteobacteria bacterium]
MSTETTDAREPTFSKVRAALFPIHNIEIKKFLPLALIMLCVLFNYTILRDTKDSLIATAPGAGPEAIPYLKAIFVMLGAMSFVVLYTKLTNMFSSEKLFYGIVTAFLIFFAAFSFVLYPNIEMLHPDINRVHDLQAEFPRVKFLLSVWAVWTYSLFYVMSELWGSVMISLLFWQFANEIVRSSEAKRFYPLFVLIGNIALMLSGTAVVIFSDIRHSLPADVDAWGVSLQYLGVTIVVAGSIAMYIYRWMHKNVLTNPLYYDAASPKAPKKKKPKLGVMESFKYLFSSPYIGLIALLVLSYGMSINLIEVIWKKQLSLQFSGDPNGYNTFMGNFSRVTGAATISIIFLTKGIVGRFGWFTGAVITPLVLAITGGLFFALVLFSDQLNPIVMGLGFTATYMAVLVGALQNILTKGTKYALFDPTKEMAYIPLDQDLKTKGKAAVDVIGGRLGKAAGGWTILGIFTIFAVQDIMIVTPYLAVIIAGIVLAWVVGVGALSVRYNRACSATEDEEDEAEVVSGKTATAV